MAVAPSSASLLSWYIAGEPTTTNIDANYNISTSAPVVIGNDFYVSNLSSASFKGTIQEARVWNVARTMKYYREYFWLDWLLDDVAGQSVNDFSMISNIGVIVAT